MNKDEVIRNTGKTLLSPPQKRTSVCTCWHEGFELQARQCFPNRNGFSFLLIVNRALPADFWEDRLHEDLPVDSEAASSNIQPVGSRAVPAAGERLTTGQVAHTQWPPGDNDGRQRVDLHEPIVSFEEFDSHFLCRYWTCQMSRTHIQPHLGYLIGGTLLHPVRSFGFIIMALRKPLKRGNRRALLLRLLSALNNDDSLQVLLAHRSLLPLTPTQQNTWPRPLALRWATTF